MEYKHPRGEDAPKWTGISGVFRVQPDGDGVFSVEGVAPELMEEHGYEPVGEPKATEDSDSVPDLTQYAEEDLVTMGYRELQSLGSDFDDIKGNWGEGKLEEALIRKRRGQTDE